MVINNGFKFSNLTGDCFIENGTLVCESWHIVQVYDASTENRVLLDALAVNYEHDKDIINFTKKYGPLIAWSLSSVSENDFQLLHNAIETESYQAFKNNHFGRYDINLFRNIFIRLQDLVNLITAYKQKDFPNMLHYCLTLILNAPAQSNNEYNQNATADFSTDFESAKELLNDKPLIKIIKDFINTPNIYSVTEHELEVPFFIKLLLNTCTLCEKQNLSVENIVDTKLDSDITLYIKQISDFTSTLQICSGIIIADEINFVVCNIKPFFRIQSNGDFLGDWIIPDLISALYLDIFLKNANSILLKKCSNPTCSEYFETTIENTSKKYCSTRCAQLMAKRKQREREKEKKTKFS